MKIIDFSSYTSVEELLNGLSSDIAQKFLDVLSAIKKLKKENIFSVSSDFLKLKENIVKSFANDSIERDRAIKILDKLYEKNSKKKPTNSKAKKFIE